MAEKKCAHKQANREWKREIGRKSRARRKKIHRKKSESRWRKLGAVEGSRSLSFAPLDVFFLPIAPILASPHFIIIKINAWDCHDRRLSHLIVIKNSFNFIFRSSRSTLTPPCLVDSTAAKYLCRVNRLQDAMEIRWSDARWSRARGKAKRILKCAKFARKGAKQIIRSTFN